MALGAACLALVVRGKENRPVAESAL